MNQVIRKYLIIFLIFFFSLILNISGMQIVSASTMSSGWTYPTGSSNFCGYLGWLGYNPGWGYHLAQDMCNSAGNPVYSIGNGEVISQGAHSGYGCNGTCTGGCVLARYQATDGTWFTVMYGHLDNWVGNGNISAGQIVGYTRSDWNPPHLHFSIHPGYDPEPTNPWRGYTASTSNTYGFVDPIPFLNAHPMSTIAGYASVSSLSVSPNPVTLGQNFNISATLKERNGVAKTFEQLAIAILRSDNTHVFDFAVYGTTTIPANGTWSKTATNYIYASSPPGTYKAVVRGRTPGGNWFDFDTINGATNPKSFTAIAPDTTKPTVSSFSASPTSVTLGNSFTISYTVSDTGGSGLKQVELWRAPDSGGSPGTWAQIATKSLSGNGPTSGTFTNAPSAVGTYWYGIHVLDNALPTSNMATEPSPKKVTVTSNIINGVCGSSNGGTFTIKPTTNLCSSGSASTVSGSGPWTWSCAGSNGGSTASCSANIQKWTVNATAGSNGTISPTSRTVNHGSATTFTVTPNGGYKATMGGTCGGSPASGTSQFTYTTNAITSNCTVTATFTLAPTNGVCGASNGGTFTLKPTTNLCSVGTPSSVSGSGPWTWSCAGSNGGSPANCSANIKSWTVTPSAGSGGSISPNTQQSVTHGYTKSFTVTPNNGYTATVGGTCGGSPASGSSQFTYTTNPIVSNCTVSVTFTTSPVNGICGSANGQTFMTTPTTNLCNAGTASAVSGSGPWSWSCAGLNGGAIAYCYAEFQQSLPVLRISGNNEIWYPQLQTAYNASVNTDYLLTSASDFYEDLNFNRDISVTVLGGCSSDFYSVAGFTSIYGKMTISAGTVIVDNLILTSLPPDVVGTWTLMKGCTNGSAYSWYINGNGTFSDNVGTGGTWTLIGSQITLYYTDALRTTYSGVVSDSTYMSGTASIDTGATMCWYAYR